MVETGRDYSELSIDEYFGADMVEGSEPEAVTKEQRKQRVLAFLVDCRLALPRKALYRNMAYQGADFSEGSIKNYLRELREEGFVERIDAIAFEEGSVLVSDDDPGYWVATSEGHQYITSIRSDQRDDIDTSHL